MSESLVGFVDRLSESMGCYYHLTISGIYSIKKFDSAEPGKIGVFAWAIERKNFLRIDTYKDLADKAGVGNLADGIKKRMHWERTGIFFRVMKGSNGEDYQKALDALKAIMSLI